MTRIKARIVDGRALCTGDCPLATREAGMPGRIVGCKDSYELCPVYYRRRVGSAETRVHKLESALAEAVEKCATVEAEVERLTAELEASEQPRPADTELCKECERAHGEQLLKALDRAESAEARVRELETTIEERVVGGCAKLLNRCDELVEEKCLAEAKLEDAESRVKELEESND